MVGLILVIPYHVMKMTSKTKLVSDFIPFLKVFDRTDLLFKLFLIGFLDIFIQPFFTKLFKYHRSYNHI